ncbi:TetR/AcrR family transcriptional regulator [Brevundimonas vitis]|uniref:TetR/AcrR family transcriptional regulator n=1 Tax=Brevundimonas vitisensis TaxID=2800818 RepID=A0ABX7BQ90_9CAUL|nr:TetR/AcrR family transcriptional regulator [Brevundimonas vitisensis]QQQ19762.1 TetR/AcrR family transcriptional regulator [Brevundimonas vitisensis]
MTALTTEGSTSARRPSLREAQRALTRDRLRSGARDLFAETSYIEATIDQIALRAGVGRATFYLHYESKDALLRDLLIQDMMAHRRLYHRLTDLGARPSPETISPWIRRYMQVFSERRAAVSLFNVAIGADPGFLAEITRQRDALFDDLGGRLEAFRFTRDAPGRSRRMSAHLLVFQIEQFCTHAAFADWDAATCDDGVSQLASAVAAFLEG